MGNSPKIILEQTLFLWSVLHNKVLSFKDRAVIGRNHEPFSDDQYLDKEHLQIILEKDRWYALGQETTNGTHLNTNTLDAGQKVEIVSSDVIMGGDQIFVVLGRDMANTSSREEFLKNIHLDSKEFAEQSKSIQTRSVAFFKLEFPNFVNLIKRTELLRKIEIAEAKKAQDIKPFSERISQLQAKKSKVEQAWNNKISEFKLAIENIKDQ